VQKRQAEIVPVQCVHFAVCVSAGTRGAERRRGVGCEAGESVQLTAMRLREMAIYGREV